MISMDLGKVYRQGVRLDNRLKGVIFRDSGCISKTMGPIEIVA